MTLKYQSYIHFLPLANIDITKLYVDIANKKDIYVVRGWLFTCISRVLFCPLVHLFDIATYNGKSGRMVATNRVSTGTKCVQYGLSSGHNMNLRCELPFLSSWYKWYNYRNSDATWNWQVDVPSVCLTSINVAMIL